MNTVTRKVGDRKVGEQLRRERERVERFSASEERSFLILSLAEIEG